MSSDAWINPDELYEADQEWVSIIYGDDIGLRTSDTDTHSNLVDHGGALGDRDVYSPDNDYYFENYEELHTQYLFGRIGRYGDDDFILSFWNGNPRIYNDLLHDCLVELDRLGLLPDDETVHIHTPFGIKHTRGGETKKPVGTELSPEQKERLELQKRLHLMRGNEKKLAMKKLGLMADKPAKHPWQAGMEKAGEVVPGQKWWAPHSESIEGIARIIPEDIGDTIVPDDDLLNDIYTNQSRTSLPGYIDPDELLNHLDGYYTFAYNTDSGLLIDQATDHHITHSGLFDSYYAETGDFLPPFGRRSFAAHWLLGRMGKWYDNRFIISFWNLHASQYTHLGYCLDELSAYVPDGAAVEIHTPFGVQKTAANMADTSVADTTELSPEQRRELELRQRLHLMRPNEKKKARKELGLMPDKPAKHPWQAGMEKAGEVVPGQKWWAPHSESIEGIARIIPEDI